MTNPSLTTSGITLILQLPSTSNPSVNTAEYWKRVLQPIIAQPKQTFHLITLSLTEPEDDDTNTTPDMLNNVQSTSHITLNPPHASHHPKLPQHAITALHTITSQLINGTATAQTFVEYFTTMETITLPKHATSWAQTWEAWSIAKICYSTLSPTTPFKTFIIHWQSLIQTLLAITTTPLPTTHLIHVLDPGYTSLIAYRLHDKTNAPVLVSYESHPNSNNTIDRTIHKNCEAIIRDTATEHITLPVSVEAPSVAPPGPTHENNTNHPPTIRFAGTMQPAHDVKSFIRTIALLQEHIPDIRVLLPTSPETIDTDYALECNHLIHEHELENTIHAVTPDEATELLQQTHLIACSDLQERSLHTLLEYASAGIPIVTTDHPTYRDIVLGTTKTASNPTGTIAPLADPPAMAYTLYHLFSDANWYAQCSHNATQRIRTTYTPTHCSNAWKALYAPYLNLHIA